MSTEISYLFEVALKPGRRESFTSLATRLVESSAPILMSPFTGFAR